MNEFQQVENSKKKLNKTFSCYTLSLPFKVRIEFDLSEDKFIDFALGLNLFVTYLLTGIFITFRKMYIQEEDS